MLHKRTDAVWIKEGELCLRGKVYHRRFRRGYQDIQPVHTGCIFLQVYPVRNYSRINFSHIYPQCGQLLCGPKEAPGKGSAETPRWGGIPPKWVGASIASSYTPSALAGAWPRHPLPLTLLLKGRKSSVQKNGQQAESAPQKIRSCTQKYRFERLRFAQCYQTDGQLYGPGDVKQRKNPEKECGSTERTSLVLPRNFLVWVLSGSKQKRTKSKQINLSKKIRKMP